MWINCGSRFTGGGGVICGVWGIGGSSVSCRHCSTDVVKPGGVDLPRCLKIPHPSCSYASHSVALRKLQEGWGIFGHRGHSNIMICVYKHQWRPLIGLFIHANHDIMPAVSSVHIFEISKQETHFWPLIWPSRLHRHNFDPCHKVSIMVLWFCQFN